MKKADPSAWTPGIFQQRKLLRQPGSYWPGKTDYYFLPASMALISFSASIQSRTGSLMKPLRSAR